MNQETEKRLAEVTRMADALRRQRDTFGPRHDLTAAAAALIERAQAQHPALAGHALSPSTLILEMNEPGARWRRNSKPCCTVYRASRALPRLAALDFP